MKGVNVSTLFNKNLIKYSHFRDFCFQCVFQTIKAPLFCNKLRWSSLTKPSVFLPMGSLLRGCSVQASCLAREMLAE